MHDHAPQPDGEDHQEAAGDDASQASIYVCFEPDQSICAERIDGWHRTNDDLAEYSARVETPIDAPEAAAIKARLSRQIREADVLICVIGPTTWLNEWVAWELETAKADTDRKGLVAIMLHHQDLPPSQLQDAGTVFIRFRREQLEGAIVFARQVPNHEEDFMFLDE